MHIDLTPMFRQRRNAQAGIGFSVALEKISTQLVREHRQYFVVAAYTGMTLGHESRSSVAYTLSFYSKICTNDLIVLSDIIFMIPIPDLGLFKFSNFCGSVQSLARSESAQQPEPAVPLTLNSRNSLVVPPPSRVQSHDTTTVSVHSDLRIDGFSTSTPVR